MGSRDDAPGTVPQARRRGQSTRRRASAAGRSPARSFRSTIRPRGADIAGARRGADRPGRGRGAAADRGLMRPRSVGRARQGPPGPRPRGGSWDGCTSPVPHGTDDLPCARGAAATRRPTRSSRATTGGRAGISPSSGDLGRLAARHPPAGAHGPARAAARRRGRSPSPHGASPASIVLRAARAGMDVRASLRRRPGWATRRPLPRTRARPRAARITARWDAPGEPVRRSRGCAVRRGRRPRSCTCRRCRG